MIRRIAWGLWLGLWLGLALARAQGTDPLSPEAEALVGRGEFAKAHALYERIKTNDLPTSALRWVGFRRGDTGWRMRQGDTLPPIEEAAPELVMLGKEDVPTVQRDRVWAEAQESIGDFHSRRQDDSLWVQTRYQNALNWWAAQTNLNLARERYLGIVRKSELPPGWPGQRPRYGSINLPDEFLEKALLIAERPADLAPLRLLQALRLGQRTDARSMIRAQESFDQALAASAGLPGRDVVLWQYGQWRERSGRLAALSEGHARVEPDPAGAVKLYRQLQSEFAAGTSRWRDPAGARLEDLTGPAVSVATPGTFLPGSEIVLPVGGRNVSSVTVTFRSVELGRDLTWERTTQRRGDWKDGVTVTGPIVAEQTLNLEATTPHVWVQKQFVLAQPLHAGAYLVEVKGGGRSARELVLVTDVAVVIQAGDRQLVSWVVDSATGRPLTGVSVRAARRTRDTWAWIGEARLNDGRGLATFELTSEAGEVLVVAGTGGHQTWAQTWAGSLPEELGEAWRIYAFTDRSAYRPGDSIQWKFTARKRVKGAFTTPAGARLGYEIRGPQGNVFTNGVTSLNTFGSAWGGLALNAAAELGAYEARFFLPGRPEQPIGEASLFRLEEYRLPEFEVTVTPPQIKESDGALHSKRLRAGEPIAITIAAKYYFGGPVPGAKAEVVVRQNSFAWWFPMPREFPWLYSEPSPPGSWRGNAEVVRRETLTLDGKGRANFIFDPGGEAKDAEYIFEVAVTDASRREVRTEKTLRATVDGYAVRADALNRLPRPGQTARVEFRAQDANQEPVTIAGEVAITREYWWEVWLDSLGREVSGDELAQRRRESPVWPPKVDPGMKEWTLKSEGYRADAISTQRVTTGTNGVGELKFIPEREGYYRLVWQSPDIWAMAGTTLAMTNRIRAECALWATTGATNLGYHTEELELLVDRDAFRVGEKAPVMVTAANPGRWIWLTMEADGLASQQVFQMTGTTRLIELEITERLVPNFLLKVASVVDQQLNLDAKNIVVPPVRNFLQVDVTPDQTENRPGAEGRLAVTTRDWEGKPTPAEVAVSLVDESVFYIQSELAPDPRQFFFGDPRNPRMNGGSSFDRGAYRRFVRGRNGDPRDANTPEEAAANTSGLPKNLTPLPVSALGLEMDRVVINGSLAPTVSLAETAMAKFSFALAKGPAAGLGGALPPGNTPEPVVVVRRDFRATAWWQPDVKTGPDGQASVSFRYPDSTTRWLARGVAATTGNQVGLGTNHTVTRAPLMVRLQTPRFLTTGDSAVISANLNNNTDQPLTVTPTLSVAGVTLVGRLKDHQPVKGEAAPVNVPAGGEARVDWLVRAEQAGTARITVEAKSATEADAMERELPILDYGLEQWLTRSGKATEDVTVKLNLPTQLKGPARLFVNVTPSLAVTMLDALPYLADYPYGCTEQTLSRFLPAVIVRKTLRDVGLDAETVMARAFGGINTNALGQVAPGLGRKKDLLKLDDMVAAGLQRLYGFQHGNGAWGWWAEGSDDAWMTAYVVWGLRLAQTAGVVVEEGRLIRAERWLGEHLVEFENAPDRAAWALNALAKGQKKPGQPWPSEFERRAFERAFARRAELNAYSQALLTSAAQQFGLTEPARLLAETLAASAVRDDAPDTSVLYGSSLRGASTQPTAHWGRTDRSWRWSDNGVEATAFAVRALLAVAPKDPQIEPAVTWLLKNRRGSSWSNTRATAITLLALSDYLKASGELTSELAYEVKVNGQKVAEQSVKARDALAAPARIRVPENLLIRGTNTLEILRRGGTAPWYFSVEAGFFSQESPITPAATDLFVRREYFRLVPVQTLLDGVVDDRRPLAAREGVASGDRLEARLVVETKNDLEYVLLEDRKPAGLEALEVQSGYRLTASELKSTAARRWQTQPDTQLQPEDFTGRELSLYVEWRDRQAAIFATQLPAGVWVIRVPYRAETPGLFAALPFLGEAMYAPEIRGNSASQMLDVRESGR